MMNFVAIDFETANSERMSACSVGLVVVAGGVIVNRVYRLIKPTPNRYDAINVSIHNISSEDTEDMPTFDVVWKEIATILDGQYVVAHRAQFDMGVIKDALAHFNISMPECYVVCTEVLSRVILDSDCYALEAVVKLLGLPYENHHHALFDAEMTANILITIAQKHNNMDIPLLLSDNSVKLGSFTKEGYTPCIKKRDTSQFAEYMKQSGHIPLSGDMLKKDLSNANPNHLFYDKKVVITGVFDFIDRESLAMKIKNCGADINTAISKCTDFVLAGDGAGPVKIKKIEKLNNDGCHIEIITAEILKEIIRQSESEQTLSQPNRNELENGLMPELF